VLDIDGSDVVPGNADADGYRSFSGTASVVATDGVAFMKGLSAGGVLSVVKHFPGLGGVSPNTDVGAASTKPWSVVTGTSLSPFRAAIAAGARAIMISNATIPGLTTGPATLSSSVYSYLRHQMGFTGLLMTDSLSAGAITDAHVSLTAAAVDAIAAGANDVLFGLPATSSALATANAITEAIFNAVATHRITRATLVDDASQVLVAKSVNLCTS
jgi:beta-N-acetylhexosaminidase